MFSSGLIEADEEEEKEEKEAVKDQKEEHQLSVKPLQYWDTFLPRVWGVTRRFY